MGDTLPRRRFLETSLGASVSVLAGCIGGGGTGAGDGAGDGGVGYADWLPDPETLGGENWHFDHYDFFKIDFDTVQQYESSFDDEVYATFESLADNWPLSTAGIPFDSVSGMVSLASGIGRFSGDFDSDSVAESLESADFERDGEHGEYEFYSGPDFTGAAVRDGSLLSVQQTSSIGPDDFEDILETVIDTKRGENERYAEARENFETLVDELGDGTFVDGTTREKRESDYADPEDGELAGTVARGKNVTVDSDVTTVTHVRVLSSEDDVDMDAVDEWAEEGFLTEALSDVSTSQNGRTVVVTGEVPTSISGFNHYTG